MIRQPFNSAIGRTRADLSRVTDGIAASLRAFSTAQQLAAAPQDNNDGSRPTGRQRAAAAFSDLVELNKRSEIQPSSDTAPTFRRLDLRSESPIIVPRASSPGGPNIIRGGLRGGFRGRGGFIRGGAAGVGGSPGMMGSARGGRGRGQGQGRGRGGRGGRGERGGRGRRRRDDKDSKNNDNQLEHGWSPEVIAMREAREVGSLHQFDPSISKSDLAGWGPAVAITGSNFAKEETAIRQARILGGGRPFHPLDYQSLDDKWKQYTKGNGLFFPTEEEKKRSAEAMGLEAFPPVPTETKTAVLQSALLGTYSGPQYADLTDTLGIVRSYVKKEASWSSAAERRIEEKIRSLLPGGRPGPTKATGAKA
ncbi:hypothetical protein F5X98DRAFT_105021 [Xylaria grammica]|nr:hypothetical protein F5X98DRAFT_105021 [Xylaria grammica]